MCRRDPMAIRYCVDADFGMTFVRWSGLVTASDFLAHTTRLRADSAWPPPKHLHLTDLREARLDRSVTGHLLVKIAEVYRRHPGIEHFKVAMVASNFFKQAMVFQRALRPSASVIVFSEFAMACTWLGVTPYYAERRLRGLAPRSTEPRLRRIASAMSI
jgi:hypothetical protein